MKNRMILIVLLTVLCLLAGCASTGGQPAATVTEIGEQPVPTEPAVNPSDTSAFDDSDPTAASGEPEGWEEEWPAEYPVENYRLFDGAIRQTGNLNKYRYEQLPGAENYRNLVADYVRQALSCGDNLTMTEDSPHDGYANWFMEAENGSAAVSGSSITGRFTFGLYPTFDRILEMTGQVIEDQAAMEQAAWAFVQRFSGITGELVLLKSEEEPQYYHDERSSELKDVTVPAIVYTFRSASVSEVSLEIQDGLTAPVACGDSTIDDLNTHCFTVTVWPDGTVVEGNNYITQAPLTEDGTARMLDESNLPELMTYLTSFSENDTLVIEEIRADSFSVYFGYATVEPIVTVKYHFESNPTDSLSTEFSMGLFGEG